MHEFIMNIGYAILNWFGSIDTGNLLTALSIMGTGMLGIFIVTGIIMSAVAILNKLTNRE